MEEFTQEKTSDCVLQELLHNPDKTLVERSRISRCLYRELIFTNPHECLRQKRVKNYQGLYEQEAFHVPFSKVRKQLLTTTLSSSQKQTMHVHLEFCTISEIVKVLSQILPKHSNLRGLHLIFSEEITYDPWRKIGSLISRFSHLNSLTLQFRMKKPEMNERELARMYRFISMLPSLTNLAFALTQNETNLLQSGFLRAAFIPDNNHDTEGLIAKMTSRLKKLKAMELKVIGQDSLTDAGVAIYGKALSELPKIRNLSLQLYGCRRVTNQGLNTYLSYIQANSQVKKLSLALNISEDSIDTKSLPIMHPIWTNKNLDYGSLEIKFASIFLSETLNAVVTRIEKINCLGRLVLNFTGITAAANTAIEKLPFVLSNLPSLTELTIRFINCSELDYSASNNIIYGLNSCADLKKASLEFLSCFKKIERTIPEIAAPLVSRPNLKELSINFVNCAEIQETQVNRIEELLTNCANLEAFTLQITWSKNLLDEQYQKFMKALSTMLHLQRLTWGFEGNKRITRNSNSPSGKMMTKFSLLRYADINLSYFPELEDESMAMRGGWYSQLKYLETLKLNFKGCSRVTDEGIKEFCLNLKGLRKLGTLTLVWNSANIREFSKKLASQLAINIPSLYCIEFHAVKKNGQTSKVCIRLAP